MSKRWLCLMMFWLIAASVPCYGATKVSHPFVDREVAGLKIMKSSIDDVYRKFGKQPGYSSFESHGDELCYFDSKDNVIMRIASQETVIDGIILLKPDEKDAKQTGDLCEKIQGKSLVSGKGIAIGDSIEKVTSVYGQPQKSKTENGMLIYEYHTDHENDPDVELYYDLYLSFENGALVEMSIHDGE